MSMMLQYKQLSETQCRHMNSVIPFHFSCSISLKPRHTQPFCADSATLIDRNATIHDAMLCHLRDEYLRFEIVREGISLTALANAASMIPQHISDPIPD